MSSVRVRLGLPFCGSEGKKYMRNGLAAKGATKPKSDGLFMRMVRFVKEAYVEVRYKTTWPNWTELKKFTAVVIIAVLIVTVWIAGLDGILSRLTLLIPGR